jgi:hypothetical protein
MTTRMETAQDVWIVHSSLTTRLHTERGRCAYDAFEQWCCRHGLTGRVLAGQRIDEPLRHLDLALQTGAAVSDPQLHRVHIVRKRLLTEQP